MKRLALTLFLAACSPYSLSGGVQAPIAATGSARPDVGTICVIRSSSFAQAVTFVIHDNQTLVGATKGHSYFCYEAEVGPHTIVSDTFDATDHPGRIQIAIDPGVRYWLLQDHENSFGSVTSKLAWIDEVLAAELVADCEYRVITETPGHEPVPPPVPYALAAYDRRSR